MEAIGAKAKAVAKAVAKAAKVAKTGLSRKKTALQSMLVLEWHLGFGLSYHLVGEMENSHACMHT